MILIKLKKKRKHRRNHKKNVTFLSRSRGSVGEAKRIAVQQSNQERDLQGNRPWKIHQRRRYQNIQKESNSQFYVIHSKKHLRKIGVQSQSVFAPKIKERRHAAGRDRTGNLRHRGQTDRSGQLRGQEQPEPGSRLLPRGEKGPEEKAPTGQASQVYRTALFVILWPWRIQPN